MSVLAECPFCHRRQTVRSKKCESKGGKGCGADLEKARRAGKVKYWITYRLPGGKQRFEKMTGENATSLEFAKAADAKRRVQKRENRIFEMLPEATMTFRQLTEWYLSLEKVKALASYKTVKVYLDKFNREFGDRIVNTVKPSDLENHQVKRQQEGNKPKTIDDELNYAKGMVIKAFNDNKVGGDVLKTFRNVKKTLKPNSNRRERILTVQEFEKLLQKSPQHLKDILIMGYWTGMRKGEILNLTWDKVDLKNRVIRLESSDTKERAAKTIPLGQEVIKMLERLPRGIHKRTVFLYNGEPIINRFETAIKTACDKAGIKWGRNEKDGFIFHDLRHGFITDMRRAGVDRTVTMAITGHSIQDMNQRYDTVEEWEKLEAITKLEAYRNKTAANVDQTVNQIASPGSKILILNK